MDRREQLDDPVEVRRQPLKGRPIYEQPYLE